MTDEMSPELFAALGVVVDQNGWAGTTAELVAQAAGVNRTTLYRHGYTTKRMLAEAAATISAGFKRAAIAPLAGQGNARSRMLALLDALYEHADGNLGLIAGLYDGPTAIFHLGGDQAQRATLTRFEYIEPFERLLLDGVADGSLHSDDPRTDAELIFNTAGWTYIHFRRSHRWAPTKAREAVTRITLAVFLS